ncbi:hypothetical protein JMF97_06105 [Micromonospora fiedleri]|uniref:Nuclear transport factor 2 family protein n=1 Tax=Micromonospora fiedleri TaxID=1157498 RepID=A0ABS1UHN6_9ACTN|nr:MULTISPECIES: hypothetical protein [Micromonospora]MBL6275729.1 hypothetical protein [Micromonospora fiedleri]WSK41845.1 hypothetical protein OG712_25670 [Micromonospora maris]
MRVYQRSAALVLLATVPFALVGCGLIGGDEEPAEQPGRAPADEALAKSRERVQAYLDAMTAKDVAAGRSQLCTVLHESFDAAATGPNGDFADHFTVTQTEIVDIRPGPVGQEVSTVVTVTVGKREASRSLLFTVTRDGLDWCISGEQPGGHSPSPTPTP